MEADRPWVSPTEIPFADLRARDLEACVFWLLDAMGARDLEWRTGGSGAGAPDGGRDLEATFYLPSPDGEMDPQRWWIECKGRKGTVEPDEVRSAVNNATMLGDLAHLVVVTNTMFSNPTRDWVRAWQASHPRPRVRLWDRDTLERLLSRHPSVVLRLFSEALSPPGLLKVAADRFWDRLEHAPARTLRTLWSARAGMAIDPGARFALIASESAQGTLGERPWGVTASQGELLETTGLAFANLGYLRFKAAATEVDETPIVSALNHLVVACLQVSDADVVSDLILEAAGSRDGEAVPAEVLDALLVPVLDRLAAEMQDVCTADCGRISGSDASALTGPHDPVSAYLRGFDPTGAPDEREPRSVFRMERLDAPCRVGYDLNAERHCPICNINPAVSNVRELLSIVARVSRLRIAQASEAARGEAASGEDRQS